MKKFFAVFCLVFLTAALFALDKGKLAGIVPADTTFALGIDTARLYSLPLFQKYFANTFFVKSFEKNVKAGTSDRKLGQYMLISSRSLTADGTTELIQMPNAAEMKKQAVPVKYGANTAYRIGGGFEFVCLADDMVLWSTGTGLKAYFSAEKGLPTELARFLADAGSGTIFSGFMVPSAELKKTNPMAAPVKLVSYTVDTVDKANSDLRLGINIACVSADAAKQTMMTAQQLQLVAGMFINNMDPDLAQSFNQAASIVTDGNNVRLKFLFTEKLIQKLSVLAEPGVLKSMMTEDSDF